MIRRGPDKIRNTGFTQFKDSASARKERRFVADGGINHIAKKKVFKNLKEQKLTRRIARGAIGREIKGKLQEGNDNPSLEAIVRGTSGTMGTARAVNSIRRITKNSRDKKRTKNAKTEIPASSLAEKFPMNRRMGRWKGGIQAVGRSITAKNTKDAIVGTLESRDITDSGAGSINMAIRGAEVVTDAGVTAVRSGKSAYKAYQFVKSRKAKKMAARTMARTVMQDTVKHSAIRVAIARGASIAKAIITTANPVTISIVAIICLILLLVVASSNSMVAVMPTSMVMAEEDAVKSYVEKTKELDIEFQNKINSYKPNAIYDDVVIEYMNSEMGVTPTNWQEILALIAVECEQELSFSHKEQQLLKKYFNLFNKIATKTETYSCGSSTCKKTHTRLIVKVYSYSMEDVIDNIGFEEWEKEWARQLVISDIAAMFPGLGITSPEGGASLTPEEIKILMEKAPTANIKRSHIKDVAMILVGRVPYFWGGKSAAGWNDKWNTKVKVTAPGNDTTGTYQPYGLDCSGYTDWVYKSAGVGSILSAGGTAYQWNQSYQISESELKIGDLVFKQPPSSSGINHVGIYVGKDSKGKKLYCHCAWSEGVVVDSYKGFKYFRRPFVKFKD